MPGLPGWDLVWIGARIRRRAGPGPRSMPLPSSCACSCATRPPSRCHQHPRLCWERGSSEPGSRLSFSRWLLVMEGKGDPVWGSGTRGPSAGLGDTGTLLSPRATASLLLHPVGAPGGPAPPGYLWAAEPTWIGNERRREKSPEHIVFPTGPGTIAKYKSHREKGERERQKKEPRHKGEEWNGK